MASIGQIKIPGETNNYNLSVPFVLGTGSTAGTWEGTLSGLTAYYDGLLILYKPSVAGASTTTLNLNGLGAKTCYINNTSKLTTHFPVNQPILLVYSSSQNSGSWLAVDNYTDGNTKNTAGSTDTSSKIFLVGATSQAANPQTYSHDTVYVGTDGHVYSNSKQAVNLSDSQALTNKTYNGYTLGDACAKGVDTTVTSGSANLVTSGAVYTAIDNLPEPMVFKGSLGTGGTITALPIDGSASIGDTYKVITAGTYASQAAKVGDTFICDSKTSSANTWTLIPSGDEPSGTVTSVTIKATSPIAIDSSSAITTSGTRTLSHANSGVTAGTYTSVTVNATGHVTAGTNPTTLSGYGITDAKIASGVITLGSNTITPLTSASTLDATKLSGTIPSGCYTDTKNTAGSTDTSSKIFLIGATSQAANPQTYSDNEVFATSGVLTTKSVQVGGGSASLVYDANTQAINFVFS